MRMLHGLGLLVLLASGCRAELAGSVSDPFDLARERLAKTPHDAELHLTLARIAMIRGDWLRAAQYHALVEHGPLAAKRPEEVFRLGLEIAIRSRSWSEAIRRCQDRLQQAEDLNTRSMLALLHEAAGEPRAAERQHQLIVRLHPDAVAPLIDAARFYERAEIPGHLEQALSFYQRFLARAEEGPDAAAARAALEINRYDAAQRPR